MATGLNSVEVERQFVTRLTEAIAWCVSAGSLLRPDTSLRTCRQTPGDLSSQDHQVFLVALERSQRLSSSGKRNLPPVTNLCGGRLLAYFPNDNLFDGFAEVQSKGFFDVNNIPPHDTWVWMVRNSRIHHLADGGSWEGEANYLVAWVPPDFIQLADIGVDANPEACVVWLETLEDEFVQSLRRLKFIA
jgi:hypothetical protein